ncbi:uncharacterized protein [Panulirus ornatus]|uniref:uncharacterized protein n=1 Tax=Panulirus ornatus TaxID=150431 RepID=UPI003A8AF8FF
MRALQVLLVAVTAVLMLENGVSKVEAAPQGKVSLSRVYKNSPGTGYAYSTRHGSSSASTNAVVPSATVQSTATGTHAQGDLLVTGPVRLTPVDHTMEVKKARKAFFSLYDKQARLAAEAPDTDFGTLRYGEAVIESEAEDDDDHHTISVYYAEDDEEEDEDEGDDDEEEEEEDEEDEEEEDSEEEEEDEYEEDSDEEGDDSSSSEEDYGDSSSSEEDGEDSSEEGEDSSEEGDDSSSSSSSSSSEEDGEYGLVWGARGWTRQRLTPGALRLNQVTPKPISDTLEVKQAKKKFYELYKTQAEMSFNAPDH